MMTSEYIPHPPLNCVVLYTFFKVLKHTTFEKKTMHHLLILFVNRNFSVDWLTRIYEISEKRLFFGGCGVVCHFELPTEVNFWLGIGIAEPGFLVSARRLPKHGSSIAQPAL